MPRCRTRWRRSCSASYGHGRRVQVTKTSDSKKNYPLYGLDGKLLVEDNRQTLKRTEYIYVGGRLIAKRIQPITAAGANNGAATVTTIHTDFLGSPVAETNSAGTVTRVERYTPYGEPADMQLDVGPGFTGHATDIQTGLTYMQQRYYDAEIGRFISPDPVGPEEDFVNHFNRYNYAQNNPVRYTDPDGRDSGPCNVSTNAAIVHCSTGAAYQGGADGGGESTDSSKTQNLGANASRDSNQLGEIDITTIDPVEVALGLIDILGGTSAVAIGGGTMLGGMFSGIDDGVFGGGIMIYGGLTIANGAFTVMNGLDGGSRESSFEQLGGALLGAPGYDAGKMIDEFPISTPSRAIRGITRFIRRKLSADDIQAITEQALETSEKKP